MNYFEERFETRHSVYARLDDAYRKVLDEFTDEELVNARDEHSALSRTAAHTITICLELTRRKGKLHSECQNIIRLLSGVEELTKDGKEKADKLFWQAYANPKLEAELTKLNLSGIKIEN